MDNSDIMQKVAIRHQALKALGRRPALVLDMFAGEGLMTRLLWSGVSERVICIERDAAKAALIGGAYEIIIGDNADHVSLASTADLIDCDAYGLVMPLIEQLPSGKIVTFTDGTLYAKTRNYSLAAKFIKDTRRLFRYCEYSESGGGTAYYGWGITK